MKTWRWLAILALGLLVVLLLTAFMFRGAGYRWMPMHPRFGGFPMMGSHWIFGGGMMFFGFLAPLLLVGLIVVGSIAIYNGLNKPTISTFPRSCPHCAKPVQADWANCPYCGEKL